MILGIGIDIVEIKRVEKILKNDSARFLKKYFTAEEIMISEKYKGKKYAAYFAKRFAAKEAVAKALGAGFGKNLSFNEINIGKKASNQPQVELSGKAAKILKSMGKNAKIHISLADEAGIAQAMAMIEAR